MTRWSERQRSELRDAAARSRLEYDEQKQGRREALQVAAPPDSPDAFLVAGDIAEYVTVLEQAAGELEDAELSRAVQGLRAKVVRVGDLLARRRAAYG